MTGFKKLTVPRQSSYNSLYVNPLTESRHSRCCSEGGGEGVNTFSDDKENAVPNKKENVASDDKENAAPLTNAKQFSALKSLSTKVATDGVKQVSHFKSLSTGRALKPSSLEFCMQMNEPDKAFGLRLWEANDSEHSTEHSSSLKIWDYSDSEAAPASSWSTLPNRALLCRPLPLDIGRCTCVIVKEACPRGLKGVPLFSLYTNEGQGRQNRKLAVAYHKRRNGKSQFTIAQNTRGIKSKTDDSFIGTVTANLMGSKYHIRDQTSRLSSINRQSNPVLAIVMFMPTITTLTGSYRSMRAYIPKHQSMLLKSTTHISSADSKVQHINGLPKDWEGKLEKVHKLSSRIPQYNNISKQYELDYRDRGRAGLRIQSSVKNFQLTLEEDGRQTILQLGRVGKSKYVMDFRYPLTGYQAFCICLASIDSKLCCTI
ncbi:tubby-like protein 8 [Pistacia vera]|uniref:tubby-like protein 8 n=1 Tax=Pistacia vera TaxID=55513 RepID=UPI0012636C5A|nr:tubby-like protein 8 [Pistacia vera]